MPALPPKRLGAILLPDDRFHVEEVAHRAQAGCERKIQRAPGGVVQKGLPTPFHGQRPGSRTVLGEVPNHPGVAGNRLWPLWIRGDEKVRHILGTAHRLVSVEQRHDLARHQAGACAMCHHGPADQIQPVGHVAGVDHRADIADAVGGRGPVPSVIDVDESDVQREVGVRHREGVHLAERQPGELLSAGYADSGAGQTSHHVDLLSRGPAHVPVGQCVQRVAVGDQTARGRGVRLVLDIDDDGQAAAQQCGGPARRGRVPRGGGGHGRRIHLHLAHRDHAPVGHEQLLGHIVVRGQRLGRRPVADEDHDAWPGKSLLHPRIDECARAAGLLTNQIATDSRPHHVGFVGEVVVIEVAGRQEIGDRQGLQVVDRRRTVFGRAAHP
ncbi:Uncharacterised protein [Mycobacteroides abscessus subsp. bolletii]|nr:Uncharacterised protein [Mycobacteroides abscessus subsp. bolletii]